MKHVLLITFFLCAASAQAQKFSAYKGVITFPVEGLPFFEDFQDHIKQPKMLAEDIDFTHSDEGAWKFRTRLRRALKNGPNFAGKYTVMTHGCGSSCQVSWIIDSETGVVLKDRIVSGFGVSYRPDSRLIAQHLLDPEYMEYDAYNSSTFEAVTYYELREGGTDTPELIEILKVIPPKKVFPKIE